MPRRVYIRTFTKAAFQDETNYLPYLYIYLDWVVFHTSACISWLPTHSLATKTDRSRSTLPGNYRVFHQSFSLKSV